MKKSTGIVLGIVIAAVLIIGLNMLTSNYNEPAIESAVAPKMNISSYSYIVTSKKTKGKIWLWCFCVVAYIVNTMCI